MDKWTPKFWTENENECKKTLMEPGNWEKVIHVDIKKKYQSIFINKYINGPICYKTFIFITFIFRYPCYLKMKHLLEAWCGSRE